MTALLTQADRLLELAERVEGRKAACRQLDCEIAKAIGVLGRYTDWSISDLMNAPSHFVPAYTSSLDAVRSAFDYMCVFASDIGADGLPLVHLVVDTSTSPVIEHVGIANCLGRAWLAAALRARASLPDAAEGRG